MLPLKCLECGRTFTYPHQLRRHRRMHTTMNRTIYRCKVCNTTFPFLTGLRQHLASHFNHTHGNGQYMDDLAIGVAIEPVDKTITCSCGGQDVGPSCCEQGLLNCEPSDSVHPTSCCCKSRPMVRCRSVMMIDPQKVVHVDMTHDPSLSYPLSTVPGSGSVGSGSANPGSVDPESIAPGNMGPESVSPECVGPESVGPGSVCPESVGTAENMGTAGRVGTGSVISVGDEAFQEEHMEEDTTEDHNADADSDVAWIFPPAECEDECNRHQASCQVIAADDGPATPVMSQEDGFSVNDVSSEVLVYMPQPLCDQGAAVVDNEGAAVVGNEGAAVVGNEGAAVVDNQSAAVVDNEISGFDDVATCNDLSNFFPDFNDKSESKPNADSKLESNSQNSMVYGEEAINPSVASMDSIYPASPRGVGHRTDLLSSDLQACVKFGLDSKALNPTVVVNDLQREIARLQKAVGRDEKGEYSYTCELRDVGLDNNKLLLKHAQLHRQVLGKRNRNKVKSENENLDSDYTIQPRNGKEYSSENKLNDDSLLKYVEKVTNTSRKAGPKFRVTVSKSMIKCYICGRHSTTKERFVCHAKRHLKKLGYNRPDQELFYCTICYAFYPCENKLREHLVLVHSNEEIADEHFHMSSDTHEHNSQTDITGKAKPSPRAKATASIAGIQTNTTQDSDMAGSTTDKLVFPEVESDAEGRGGQEVGSADAWFGICHICGGPFSSEVSLSRHISSCHGGEPREASSMPIRPRKPISQKIKIGKKIGYKCHICGRIFSTVQNLKNHFFCHDPKSSRLICPIDKCYNNYVWKQNFRRHLIGHATPTGQKFHKIRFNLDNEVFCPFCRKSMLFLSLDDYKIHMLLHVEQIMAEECARNDLPYRMKFKNSKKAAVIYRSEMEMSSVKSAHEHSVGNEPMASSTPVPTEEDNARKHPLPVVQSSSPNSCFGFADTVANDVCSGDASPAGSLQGNSGLFISPVWAPATDIEMQSKGVYSKAQVPPVPPTPHPGRPAECPTGRDSKSQLPMDLNDSGFTQTLSGDSDHGERSREPTPQQSLPSFNSFSRNTHDPRHSAATSAPDRHAQDKVVKPCAPNTDSMFHSLQEAKPRYSLRDDKKAYILKEDSPKPFHNGESYTIADDGFSYLNSNGRRYHNNYYTSADYFPRMRGMSTPFMTRERAEKLMTTSCAITADFKSVGLLCSICGKLKLDMENVKTHLLTHFDKNGKFAFVMLGKKFNCPLCFKMMLDRRSTTAHLFSHWGENLIKCPVCYKIFNLVKTLNNHVVKVHPGYRYK